jgi:hypothetical protein
MQALLYLEIIADFQETSYATPLIKWKTDLTPDVTFFDLDNLSDGLVINYAADLLEQSAKVVLLINVKSAQAPVGKILPLLEKCVTRANSLLVLAGNDHALINRYASLLPKGRSQQVPDLSVARPLVVSFLAP